MGYGPRITDYGLLIDNKQTDFFLVKNSFHKLGTTICY